jgi:MYXO-CTERM domain-containing protein
MRRSVLGLTLTLVLGGSAAAFPTGSQFDIDAVRYDGSGGVAFTGAPRWAGHTCAVCHTDGPARIGARLEASPAALFVTGYAPSTTYRLRVSLTGEWAAVDAAARGDACGDAVTPFRRCDDNGFGIEFADVRGQPSGTFSPAAADGTCDTPAADADAYVLHDGSAAVASGNHHGQTVWNLCWTSPSAGTGALTAYLAVVDGNGGDGTANNPDDMTGDDVFAGAVPLVEQGGVATAPQQGAGCAVGGGATSAGLALVVLVVLAALALRRRCLPILLAALLAGGCATVKPWQREKLAKRKMQFGADPDERELDLHMQDAREGSSGGYGSAGGGCGCN